MSLYCSHMSYKCIHSSSPIKLTPPSFLPARMGSPKLELKLNLSPAREESPERSPTSSCVSSTSPESPNSGGTMMLVGCPRCLMYVMLLGDDPKCPKCKSTVLLDFLQQPAPTKK